MPILPGSINLWAVLSLSALFLENGAKLHTSLAFTASLPAAAATSAAFRSCSAVLPPLGCQVLLSLLQNTTCKETITNVQQAGFNSSFMYSLVGTTQETEPEINVCNSFATCQHIGVVVIRCGSWLHDIWYWLDGDSEALCFICVIWGFAGLMDGTWYSHSPEHSIGCLI